MKKPTFAEKLGVEATTSQLLKKADVLGLHSSELMESLAVARGCWHYRHPGLPNVPDVPETDLSNEELAVALLLPCHAYSAHTIRVGAAMLGADGNDVQKLAELAVAEQCVAPIHYIAEAGVRFEPDNFFWRQLLGQLPVASPIPEGVMPHHTRFISMTGITRGGRRPPPIWIRPRPDLAVTHG